MKVAKWGNSLAIRLPAEVVDALELTAGDEIKIRVQQDGMFDLSRKPKREDWLKLLRSYRGTLPEGFTFDRDDAHAR